MVMGNYKNSCVFNFSILVNSRKFDAHVIYVFYSIIQGDLKNTEQIYLLNITLVGVVISRKFARANLADFLCDLVNQKKINPVE